MRLPVRKLYRAFPELDPFSDEECERYLLQAYAQRRVTGLPLLAGAQIWIVASAALLQFKSSLFPRLRGGVIPDLDLLIITAGPMAAALVTGFLVRDWLLRRALARRLDSVRCTRCRQSLMGLPLLNTGDGRHAVRCTECGSVMWLAAMGLVPADLMARAETPDWPDRAGAEG